MITNEFSAYGNLIDMIVYRATNGMLDLFDNGVYVTTVGQASAFAKANQTFIRNEFETVTEFESKDYAPVRVMNLKGN